MRRRASSWKPSQSSLIDTDPDVVTGYNILDFDWWYLAMRVELFHKIRPGTDVVGMVREAKRVAEHYSQLKARSSNEALSERIRAEAIEHAHDILGMRYRDGARMPALPPLTAMLAKTRSPIELPPLLLPSTPSQLRSLRQAPDVNDAS